MTWQEVSWTDVMEGDTVRLVGQPGTDSVVDSVSLPHNWHSKVVWEKRVEDYPNGTQQWKSVVEPHERWEVHVRLKGRPGLLTFAPDARVELLNDDALHARRLAAVLAAFPTSTSVVRNPIIEWNS